MADDAVGGPSGGVENRSEHFSGSACTLGANYDFSSQLGGFARFTRSFRTPALANIYIGASFTKPLDFTAFGRQAKACTTLFYQGRKYVDSNNTTELPAYTSVEASLIGGLDKNLRLQLMGSNLTNEAGNEQRDLRIRTADFRPRLSHESDL